MNLVAVLVLEAEPPVEVHRVGVPALDRQRDLGAGIFRRGDQRLEHRGRDPPPAAPCEDGEVEQPPPSRLARVDPEAADRLSVAEHDRIPGPGESSRQVPIAGVVLKRDQIAQSRVGQRDGRVDLGVKAAQERLVARCSRAECEPISNPQGQFRAGKIPSRAMM